MMPALRVLDLFSGIGGFSLGLERAGMRTAAFCEIDPKARLVLRKHWPDVPIFEDVAALTAADMPEKIDVICGGFPCQDISLAGKGAGLAGERSGLWFQFRRLIDEIRPAWVIVENVSALRSRGLDVVLGGLAALGYDAEWHCIPASAVGAPHQRDRVWIVAYPVRARGAAGISEAGHRKEGDAEIADHIGDRLLGGAGQSLWPTEPAVGRVVDGLPRRLDRIRQLGNAVVPQIPEMIGQAIMSWN
jgi:DNA (cytosine-5)-methyltransferase 1